MEGPRQSFRHSVNTYNNAFRVGFVYKFSHCCIMHHAVQNGDWKLLFCVTIKELLGHAQLLVNPFPALLKSLSLDHSTYTFHHCRCCNPCPFAIFGGFLKYGYPKWMIYTGKPNEIGCFEGSPIIWGTSISMGFLPVWNRSLPALGGCYSCYQPIGNDSSGIKKKSIIPVTETTRTPTWSFPKMG